MNGPIFIVGSASSGSTLLGVMLDRHSQVACGPELYVFDKKQIYGSYETFRHKLGVWLEAGLVSDGQVDTPDFFFNREAYFCDSLSLIEIANRSSNLREFFDSFFQRYLSERKKLIWAEKTGSNSYYLNEILRLYPEARIIHVLRDGRDVVCSLMGRDDSPYHCVSHWLYNVSAAIAWRSHPNYLEIRYEDLVSTPKQVLIRVCRHINVAFEPRMLQPSASGYWSRFARGNVHMSWKASPLDGAVSTSSVGRYRTDLPEEIEVLFWRARLSQYGRRKLRVSHKGVADLMMLLAYVDRIPSNLKSVPVNLCVDGVRGYLRRLRTNWSYNRRFWLPLTYVR